MPTAVSKQAYTYEPPTSSDPLEEFEQNHRSYQLFKQAGLDKIGPIPGDLTPCERCGAPDSYLHGILEEGIFIRLRQFLNNVDTAKGPITKKVIRLERRKDTDGEHLVIHCNWNAKDFMGNDLETDGIKEGMYNDPVTRTTIVNGKTIKKYQNWQAKYDIPFTPKAVDKALEGQDAERMLFMVRARTTRDDTFSLEQFRDSTWTECQEISRTGKGLNR